MAVVATTLGRVEEPLRLQGQPSQPGVLAQYVVKVVIQASDYSSGFSLATVLTATGAGSIVGCVLLDARIGAGTALFVYGIWDRANNKLRLATKATDQTTVTDYTAANGDIITMLVTVA